MSEKIRVTKKAVKMLRWFEALNYTTLEDDKEARCQLTKRGTSSKSKQKRGGVEDETTSLVPIWR